jgi:hypothetical protein
MKKDSADDYAALRKALKSLPAGQREALILVDQSRFSYEEAAELCGCTVRAFKNRVDHARSRLAEILSVQNASDFRPNQFSLKTKMRVYIDKSDMKIFLSTKADEQNPPEFAEFLLLLFATTHHAEAQVGEREIRRQMQGIRPRPRGKMVLGGNAAIIVATAKASNRQGAEMGRRNCSGEAIILTRSCNTPAIDRITADNIKYRLETVCIGASEPFKSSLRGRR